MLLGALDSLACVQDTVVGVDLFRGIVVHVAYVPLVVDSAQPNKKAVVQEPENGLPGARGNHHGLHGCCDGMDGVEVGR